MTFWGTYEHTIDDRGRVAIPARYRHLFAEGVMLAEDPDGCALVFTKQAYEAVADEYKSLPVTSPRSRKLRRNFFSSSWPAELDRQGRVLIPLSLRQSAGLNGPVVLCGRGDALEIWNLQRWGKEKALAARVAAGEEEQSES